MLLYFFNIVSLTKISCCLNISVIFQKLCKSSAREEGTMRYFREKLQRRNVTKDVKHYEDCKQFFLSLGKYFAIEALMQFFSMEEQDGNPIKHRPPQKVEEMEKEEIEKYFEVVINEFIDEFLLGKVTDNDSDNNDFVRNYSICLVQYFFILHDIKDAVHEGNGERLATLHKQLLLHFKSVPGFNTYAIEMLINIVQNKLFLSPAQSHQCIWASTANWKGGAKRNIEIDLLQENRNKDLKNLIKGMGANKTDKAIDTMSRAVGESHHRTVMRHLQKMKIDERPSCPETILGPT